MLYHFPVPSFYFILIVWWTRFVVMVARPTTSNNLSVNIAWKESCRDFTECMWMLLIKITNWYDVNIFHKLTIKQLIEIPYQIRNIRSVLVIHWNHDQPLSYRPFVPQFISRLINLTNESQNGLEFYAY